MFNSFSLLLSLKSSKFFSEIAFMKKQNIKKIITVITFSTLFSCSTLAMSNGRPKPEPSPITQPSQPAPSPSPAPQPKPPGSTPSMTLEEHLMTVTPLWESKIADSQNWTAYVQEALESLGQNLLKTQPEDAAQFCPNYKNLSYEQRKHYWAFMLSSMSKFESGFNTNTQYKEGFNDSSGRPVISRGLLQISIESSKGYGCGFTQAEELHDPYKNLACGIRILDRWVSRDQRIAGKDASKWQGGARYWSVLREAPKTSYQSILSWSQKLSFCKR